MDFDLVLKVMKICFFAFLTVIEVLSGDKPDKPNF